MNPRVAAKAHVFVADIEHPDLDEADRHHLARVLRLRSGDELTVADVARCAGAVLAEHGGKPPSLSHPVVLVGPEGGWSDEERSTGLTAVTLGDTVLRAETAAIVAGAALCGLRSNVFGHSAHHGG